MTTRTLSRFAAIKEGVKEYLEEIEAHEEEKILLKAHVADMLSNHRVFKTETLVRRLKYLSQLDSGLRDAQSRLATQFAYDEDTERAHEALRDEIDSLVPVVQQAVDSLSLSERIQLQVALSS